MGNICGQVRVSHPLQTESRIEAGGAGRHGALFTQVPERILADIGIAPSGTGPGDGFEEGFDGVACGLRLRPHDLTADITASVPASAGPRSVAAVRNPK